MTHGQESSDENPRSEAHSRKSLWYFAVRVVITLAILVALLSRIDLVRWGNVTREASGIRIVAACLWHSLALVVSTLKWDCLLRALDIFTSKWSLFRLYTIGFFASSFLPGVVGGDAVRWFLAAESGGERLKIAATILAERVSGVVALVILCVWAVVSFAQRLATAPILILLTSIAAVLILSLALTVNRRLVTVIRYSTRRLAIRSVMRRFYELHKTLRAFTRQSLVASLGYSFLFYLIGGVTLYVLCVAFGIRIAFVEVLSVQLLGSLIKLIPISVGGLGLSQAGDVYLFGLMGVEPTVAFAISICRQLINFTYQFLGGYFFARWRVRPPTLGAASPAGSTRTARRHDGAR